MIGRNKHSLWNMGCSPEFVFFNLCFVFAQTVLNKVEAQLLTSSLMSASPFQPTGIVDNSSRGLEFRRREILNESVGLYLEWEIDWQPLNNSNIIFNLSLPRDNAEENADIFLGVSRNGLVEGADVAAVFLRITNNSTEQSYLTDMHGVDNSTIAADNITNWRLDAVHRESLRVSIIISRPLDTCDTQDVPIHNDSFRILWRYSRANLDDIPGNDSMNFIPNGIVPVYLTDPVATPPETEEIKSWRLSRTFHIPPRQTTYWCTIHRGIQLPRKHHIVGYIPYFRDEISQRHVHHHLVYRCAPPPGLDPALTFEKYIGHPGEECYLEDTHQLPTVFCTEIVFSWAVGGKSFNFSNDVGLALGDTTNEYFMIETHFDNPESRSDLEVENGVDFLYTPNLREKEGSIFFVGSGILGLYQVPPQARNFTVGGQCSSKCTQEMIPPSGIEVFAVSLHSHATTRKMTVRHFRGNQELPWIGRDANYNFTFQQKRLLPETVSILPGDVITTECEMDTTSRNGTTLSGFPSTSEMCIAFLFVTKRLPYLYCTSEYPTEDAMVVYGVRNVTWSRQVQERIVNDADNPRYVGLLLSQVIDEEVGTWTPERIMELEREQLYGQHESTCPPLRRLLPIGYASLFADSISGGLIPGNALVESVTPNTRSISTFSLFGRKVNYPIGGISYEPQQNCAV